MKIKDKFKNVDFFEGWITGIACYIGVKLVLGVAVLIAMAIIGG